MGLNDACIIFENYIQFIRRCKYGAITIKFSNGASNSMFWETFEGLDLDTSGVVWLPESYCCDHCINHWGIDLCECGSGQRAGECECGSQNAHDTFGVKFDSFGAKIRVYGLFGI